MAPAVLPAAESVGRWARTQRGLSLGSRIAVAPIGSWTGGLLRPRCLLHDRSYHRLEFGVKVAGAAAASMIGCFRGFTIQVWEEARHGKTRTAQALRCPHFFVCSRVCRHGERRATVANPG